MLVVNDSVFVKEVLNSEMPVIVYFMAPWVNECALLTPIICELAREYSNRIKIVMINVDENDITTQRYNIKSMPAIVLFEHGKPKITLVGTRSKAQLREWIMSI